MYSLTVVLIAIAITFVAAWNMGYNNGNGTATRLFLDAMTEEEAGNILKRLREKHGR